MIYKRAFTIACGTLAATVLGACGGGGSDDVAGIDRTGVRTVAFGPISGFGSVIVNGVRFDTARTEFRIDGRVGTQADLEVGDVVTIKGDVSAGGLAGSAATVTFDDNVEGPVASIAADSFVVLGQTVRVDASTSFDDSIPTASLAGLRVGDIVEVSGLVEADGSIRATRIEAKAAGGELEITGVVANHDAAARRFSINAQVIDYSTATLDDFPAGMIANGQLVEVKGRTLAAGVLTATRVELKGNDLAPAAGDRVEVEGFITRFVSATDFSVAGVAVTTNAQTVVTGGVLADLGPDVKVEVEGTVNAANVVVASEIDIRRSAAVRITALVDSVNAAGGSFVTLGITVRVDGSTRVEDKTSQQLRPFTLANLNAGDYVEVRGVELPAGSGEVLAALLERETPDTETELQGFVQTVAAPVLSILGVTIDTTPGTDFEDVNDAPISSVEFFARVVAGSLVKVDGTEIGTKAIQADEVEFEN